MLPGNPSEVWQPYRWRAVDVDGDGLPDIVGLSTLNPGGVPASIYLGLVDGGFAPGIEIVPGAEYINGFTRVTAGSFVVDAEWSDGGGAIWARCLLLANWGDAGFESVVDVGRQAYPFPLSPPFPGDFNGDGYPDIAVGIGIEAPQPPYNALTIAFGLADGGFQAPISDGSWPFCSFVTSPGRYNNDSNDDLLCWNGNTLWIVFSQSDGGFVLGPQLPTSVVATGWFSSRSDLNGDGVNEIPLIPQDWSTAVETVLADGGLSTQIDPPVVSPGGRQFESWALERSPRAGLANRLSIAKATNDSGGILRTYSSDDGGLNVVYEYDFPVDFWPIELIDMNQDGILDAFGTSPDNVSWPGEWVNPGWVDGRCFGGTSP